MLTTLNQQADLSEKREELEQKLEQLKLDFDGKTKTLDAALQTQAVQIMQEKLSQHGVNVKWEENGNIAKESYDKLGRIPEFKTSYGCVERTFFRSEEIGPKVIRDARTDFIQKYGSQKQTENLQEPLMQYQEAEKAVWSCKDEINEITRVIPIFDLIQKSGIAEPKDDTLVPSTLDFLQGLMQLERVSVGSIKVIDQNTLLVLATRSQWAGSSGIARFSQMRVYFHGQTATEEWQYRDQYNAARDNYRHRVNNIGEVEITEHADKIDLRIELVNGKKYRNFHHVFSFDSPEEVPVLETLSQEDLESFKEKVEKERTRVLAELERLWEYKPEMPADYGGMTMPRGTPTYVNYQRPSVGSATVLPTGVASFISEEQIDHRTHVRQMRYELYIMKYGDDKAQVVAEDHAYEYERGAFVSVVTLSPEEVVVNTSRGERTVNL